MPRLSVNLCCYNSERYLRETLDSVSVQTWRDFEVVVVDDGSKDRTQEIVEDWRKSCGFPVIYHFQKNAGLGRARNKALELSSGELIAILDHDDVWEPQKLARQVELFRPQVGFVGSDAVFIDSAGRVLGRYSQGRPLRRGRVLYDLFLYNFVPCASVVFRRSAIESSGGFFKPDFRIAEEYELFLRLAERTEYECAEDPLVRIRVHSQSAGWDVAREREEMRRIYAELLGRSPELAGQLGSRGVSVKRAGLWLTLAQAEALAGRESPWRDRLSAGCLWALSLFGPAAVDGVLRIKRFLTRLRACLC